MIFHTAMFSKFSLSLTILTLALNLLSASSAAVPVPLRNTGLVFKGPGNPKVRLPVIEVSPGAPKPALKTRTQPVARDAIEPEECLVFPDMDHHHVRRDSPEAHCLVASSEAQPNFARSDPVARGFGSKLVSKLIGHIASNEDQDNN